MKRCLWIIDRWSDYSQSATAKALGVGLLTLRSKLKKAGVCSPIKKGDRLTREDVLEAFSFFGKQPKFVFKKKIYKDYLKFTLYVEKNGIFLGAPPDVNAIKSDGLATAQYFHNHIHLDDCVDNRVLQMLLAEKLINLWVEQVRKLNVKRDVLIELYFERVYCEGRSWRSPCICIFLKTKEVDKRFNYKECKVRKITI